MLDSVETFVQNEVCHVDAKMLKELRQKFQNEYDEDKEENEFALSLVQKIDSILRLRQDYVEL